MSKPTTQPRIQKIPDPKFEVRGSKIDGKGIFTTAFIQKGEVVLKWNPKVFTPAQAESLPEEEKAHYTYPEGDHILWMQPPERYVNHSCEANTRVIGRSDVASRDIHEGEEITSDYMDLETESFQCNCGSKRCRGIRIKEVRDEI